MEEMLKRFAPRAPCRRLRRAVLEAAAREARPTVWDRIWASRLFWSASVAGTLCGLLLAAVPTRPGVVSAVPPARPAQTCELARVLAESLGDGPDLERWLAFRLEGRPVKTPTLTLERFWEEGEWQG